MPGLVNEIIVKQYEQSLGDVRGIILAESAGMTVADADRLRLELYGAGVQLLVVKNRLLKIALENKGIQGLDEFCTGLTAVVVLKDDPISLAKIVKKFEKDLETFKIKQGYLDGQVLDIAEVKQLADIPPREVLLVKVLICLNTPVVSFVNVLSGVMRNTVGVINAIKEKKENEAE